MTIRISILLTISWMVCFSSLFTVMAQSQEAKANPCFIGIKPQYGFIIPHSESIKDISHSNPYGVEIEYGWHLNSESDWKRCNCYSKAGFSIIHMNYNNPEILGSNTNLTAFAEPYFNYKSNLMTSLRMGVGPAYTSKYYHETNNPENLFFSTPFSFFINMDFNVYYRINRQWFAQAYFKYNHISNGGINEPNKGMNFPSYGLGVEYALEEFEFKNRKKMDIDSASKYIRSIGVFGTVKNVSTGETFSERTPAYIYGIMGNYGRKVSVLNAISVGLEFISDGSVKEKNKYREKDFDHRVAGFLAGNNFIFGRFIFSQYWGTYIYSPSIKKHFYQRYALTANLLRGYYVGVTLKAHANVADNFNLMLGYQW